MFRSSVFPRVNTFVNNNVHGRALPLCALCWSYGNRFPEVKKRAKNNVLDTMAFWNNNISKSTFTITPSTLPSLTESNRFCATSSNSPPSEISPSPPTLAIPPHLDPAVIDKIVETIQSNKEFIQAGEALENALPKMANNDDDNNNNNNMKRSPLVDVLLHHQQPTSPSSSLSLVAVAIIFIYTAEMSKPTTIEVVSRGTFFGELDTLSRLLESDFGLRYGSFTEELAASWNSILSPFVPRVAALLLLKSPVPEDARTVAALVAEEYSRKIRFSCRTLAEWKTFPGSCPLNPNTIKAVNNYFAAEIELVDRLEKANKDLANRDDQQSRLDLEENVRFIEKIGQQEFPVELFDSILLSSIETLEGWIEQRKIFIEQPEKVAENKALDFIRSFFSKQLSQLQQIWIHRVQALITNDTIQSLRPGATPLFSKRPPYGLRSRQHELGKLCDILKKFQRGNKEDCPLIGFTSLPRQGKTAILDIVPYYRNAHDAFLIEDAAKVGCVHPVLKKLFAIYITFNASWACTIKTDDASVGINAAKYQMSVRLLAAACGIHRASAFLLSPHVAQLVESIAAVFNDPKQILVGIIIPRLQQLVPGAVNNMKLLILQDEFSNLEPKSSNSVVVETTRKCLYSMLSDFIGAGIAIIVSGFTAIPNLKTVSGRIVEQLELRPFNSTEDRQESIPMHSEFFRLLWRNPTAGGTNTTFHHAQVFEDPVATHELCKNSAGMLGALLELKEQMQSSIGDAIAKIPFLDELEDERSRYLHMMNLMLQWKSVQVAAGDLERNESLRQEFHTLASSPAVQLVVHLPRRAVLFSSFFKHLAHIRLEPMFLAKVVDQTSEFARFLRQLYNYGHHLTRGLTYTTACNETLTARFETNGKSSSVSVAGNFDLGDFNGAFLEDAVATGILFQTECRRSFLAKHPALEGQIKFSLSNLLSGAQKIVVFENTSFAHSSGDAVDSLQLVWALPNSDIKNNNNNNIDADETKSPGPSKIKYFPVNSRYPRTKSTDVIIPSLDVLHQPARPESNELVDMVFHLATSADSNRWVEVWIDTKHSNSAPYGGSRQESNELVYPKHNLLEESLNNPLLQSFESNIDHVVHIVVTAYRAPPEITQQLPKVHLGRLKSYSLFYVHPDSTAFENLVSQPIKEAIPLLDQQDDKNWTRKVPQTTGEWKYYRGAKRDIVAHFSSVDEFTRWRNICFDEDCSIALDNLNPELSEILPRELRSVPLGCVIEALGIRPFSVSTLQQQYYAQYRVEISNEKVQFFGGATNFSLSRSDLISQKILAQVTIGHFMHHEKDFWNELFEHDRENKEKCEDEEQQATGVENGGKGTGVGTKKPREKFLSEAFWSVPIFEANEETKKSKRETLNKESRTKRKHTTNKKKTLSDVLHLLPPGTLSSEATATVDAALAKLKTAGMFSPINNTANNSRNGDGNDDE